MSLALQGRGVFGFPVGGLGGTEPWIVQVLKVGYSLPFVSLPPLSPTPVPLPSYSPTSVRGLALAAAVADLQNKDAIELASSEPGFYSRLFITPKVTGGWRPVIDLSRLNRFVRLSRFRMETSQSVLQSLRPGDWMVSIGLQDAYLQVLVHPESHRYLRFCIGPQTFQFRALCFGLSSAPQVFTRVMTPISSIMARLGSSLQEIVRARDFLFSLCKELGVMVNLSKSSLTPTQTIDYLGMTLQSTPLKAFPTQARIHKVLSLVEEFSSSREQPLSLWRSLLWVMSSMTALIPGARLRMRSLQLLLNVAGPQPAEHALISWDEACHQDLQWWSDASHLIGGVSLDLPQPRLLLFTDASDSGWGASLGDDQLSGLWIPDISRFSINYCELLAVLLAIRGFLHLLKRHSVSLFTDNTSALAYLRKEGGTRSATLNSVAQSILRLCESNGVHLLPQFVPGKLNVLADSLSRGSQILGSEWTLCQEVCRELFRRWPVTIDLFATSLNHRLQVYFSPVVDPQAVGTDAMLQSWDGL